MAKLHFIILLTAVVVASVSKVAASDTNDEALVDSPCQLGDRRTPRLLGKAGKSSKGSKKLSKGSKLFRVTTVPPTDEPTTPDHPPSPSTMPTAEPTTDPPFGPDCAARQQMATVLNGDVCLRDCTLGAQDCPECPSSCDTFGSGSTFDLHTGAFYTFDIDRQANGRGGIWLNLLSATSEGMYLSLYRGTFCGGLACAASRDGGPCPGLQESDLEDGPYVLVVNGPEDAARYNLEFTFKGEGLPNGYPDVCSV